MIIDTTDRTVRRALVAALSGAATARFSDWASRQTAVDTLAALALDTDSRTVHVWPGTVDAIRGHVPDTDGGDALRGQLDAACPVCSHDDGPAPFVAVGAVTYDADTDALTSYGRPLSS